MEDQPAHPDSVTPATAVRCSRGSWLAVALLLLSLFPVVFWPGDVSWLIDEPRLIANAWHANHDHELTMGGLYGNFGIRYGPLPTQIYQLLLMVTQDPFTLVVLRGLLCAGVTGFSLLWLARSLGLPGWFAAALMIAPNVVTFHRVLWDASFAIPIGTLALAAFASYLRTGGVRSLRTCLVAGVLVPMIHPQALPLFLPLAGYLVWRHRPALLRDRKVLLALSAVVLVLHGCYILQAMGQLVIKLSGTVQKGYPNGASHWLTSLAPFLGGNVFTGFDFANAVVRPAGADWLVETVKWGSRLIYPLIWVGIGISVSRAVGLIRLWRQARREGRDAALEKTVPVRDLVAVVVLVGVFLQGVMFGLLRIPAGVQYYFGTFALHAFMALLAVDALRRCKMGLLLGGLYGASCAFITIGG